MNERIALIGDVMLGRMVDIFLQLNTNYGYIWGDAKKLLNNCDLAICNLECVLSNKGKPWSMTPKFFLFRGHKNDIKALSSANISAVTIANNHTLDYGYGAFLDMISSLDKVGIKHSGGGPSYAEAAKVNIFNIDDTKVGLLSFTDSMPEWAAMKDRPGVYYVPPKPDSLEWQHLLDRIESSKSLCDLLIVSPHWGNNWGYEMQPIYSDWAHKIIDAGADIIFGHSGHIPRGIEIYKNKPIIYSAGDFVNDYEINRNEPSDEGFIYILNVKNSKPTSLELYPIFIKNFQARFIKSRIFHPIYNMLTLSKKLGTTIKFESEKQRLLVPISTKLDFTTSA